MPEGDRISELIEINRILAMTLKNTFNKCPVEAELLELEEFHPKWCGAYWASRDDDSPSCDGRLVDEADTYQCWIDWARMKAGDKPVEKISAHTPGLLQKIRERKTAMLPEPAALYKTEPEPVVIPTKVRIAKCHICGSFLSLYPIRDSHKCICIYCAAKNNGHEVFAKTNMTNKPIHKCGICGTSDLEEQKKYHHIIITSIGTFCEECYRRNFMDYGPRLSGT